MKPLCAGLARFALSVVFAILASCAVADTPTPRAPPELDAANLANVIDPLLSDWINKHKGPGAVVVVATREGLVFAKGYGLADIEAKRPFTADATLVRPGSISKLFTGVAVMQLVDQGKLDLDRNVEEYLDFPIPTPEGGVPVTLRRLLTHRAGFEEHAKSLFSRDREPELLGRWLARSLPLRLFPRGDVPAYSNYGFALAGYIVERVSGEPFAAYVARHILEPLGMSRSTFRQPLPETLAAMMAKGYRAADKPLPFFETIAGAPAGALSATGTDMARFIRALLNGGALDGVRILSKERLEEMTAPQDSTAAGYLGLAFFGTKHNGYDAIGHGGGTLAFLSDLELLPAQGFGVFVSFDGMQTTMDTPQIANAIAERFLPKTGEADNPGNAAFADNSKIAGVYHSSRRAESTFVKVADLVSQLYVRIDKEGRASISSAIWPFGEHIAVKRLGPNLYEGPRNWRFVFDDANEFGGQFISPATQFQRVPWHSDARFIVPAMAASAVVLLLTLLAWPTAALWRRWRKKTWSEDADDRRMYVTARLVALVNVAVIAASIVFFFSSKDFTILNDALDPLLVTLYALAWLGVLGAIPTVWIAVQFWRKGVGGRWTRAHHSLIAASAVMVAWFFVTFHIAGTTLNY
ncbi:MAG: serine hydrolase [Methylocystis sp.]|nr:serine hydrolase [Methylocystis sp.]